MLVGVMVAVEVGQGRLELVYRTRGCTARGGACGVKESRYAICRHARLIVQDSVVTVVERRRAIGPGGSDGGRDR